MSMLQSRLGLLIPLYVYPTSPVYDQIVSAKINYPDVPMAVILNVNSGPGAAVNADYTAAIARLKEQDIITLGYTWTNFGNDSEATVQAIVDNWKTFYPTLDGIYFSGMSNQTAKLGYYSSLNSYAKTTKGFTTTAGSAGAKVPVTFFDGATVDTIVVYEGLGLPAVANYNDYETYPNENIALIPYGVMSIPTDWITQISQYAGWLYVSNDSGTNPYDSLPSYFNAMVNLVNSIGSGTLTNQIVDVFGVRKIYKTKTAGEEWFVNMADPTSDERLQNEPPLVLEADGSWSCGGSDVRIEAWSPAYADQALRQAARWLNVEITSYSKLTTEDGTYGLQVYSRGGRHYSNYPCEGTALKLRVFKNGQVGFMKEVCHSTFTTNKGVVSVADGLNKPMLNNWIGIKHMIYNVDDTTKQECWVDRNVQDVNGNLVVQNDWVKVSEWTDDGNWLANKDDFDDDCDGCGRTRAEKLVLPGGNTRTGTTNYNRNNCTWLTDDRVRWRWKYLSVREIDPAALVDVAPPPGPADPQPPDEPPIVPPVDVVNFFGVKKIYPSKLNGEEWYMDMNNPYSNINRFVPGVNLSKNADGSWKWVGSDTVVRMQVYQKNGYSSADTATAAVNHAEVALRGYMQDQNDWRNIEMTGYVRINATPSHDAFTWYARGGRHIDPQPNCEGSSMAGSLMSDGTTYLTKEQWHASYNYANTASVIGESIIGRWIGFKYIVYNKNVGGMLVVKQEIWIDENDTNDWIKMDERTDAGGWGTKGAFCLGAVDQIISWGGPIVGFSWGTFTDVDFRWLDVREIDTDAVPVDAPAEPAPGHCGSP